MSEDVRSSKAYDATRFEQIHMEGAQICEAEFHACTFSNCYMAEASLQGCRFLDCIFCDCDLSLLRVRGSSYRRTRFERSKAVGVNWADAAWPRGKPLFPSISFVDCAISYSTFTGLRLDGIEIRGCVARDVDLTETGLAGADCRDTDFEGSRFFHTNLTGADLTGASNYVISPVHNTLSGTKFSFPEALSLLRALDIVLTE